MKVKTESENVALKLNILKTKIMESGPITSWQVDGETVETVADYFLGLQNHCRWFGAMFNAFVGYSELDHQNMMDFFGYSFETAGKFWNMALEMYLGTEEEAVCQAVAEKAMIIGYTRMLRRAVRRPHEADSPAKIARCKEMLAMLLEKVDTLCF